MSFKSLIQMAACICLFNKGKLVSVFLLEARPRNRWGRGAGGRGGEHVPLNIFKILKS